MVRLLNIFSTLFFISILFSCDKEEENNICVAQPDISDIEVDMEFISLEEEFLNIETQNELSAFLNKHPIIHNYFLKPHEYPDHATFQRELLNKLTNPHLDTLLIEVERVFKDKEALKEEFTRAFRHLKYYYPEVEIPKVKTIATGFDQDMYISDSLIIVGLDYYLGEGAKYRPLDMYQYMLKRYRPEYIIPSAMLIYGISPRFNETDLSDKSVIAEMITYGKAFYFAKHMMPCTPDSVLIWYTSEEMEGVRKNDDIIWSHFVENEIIFNTSHEIKRKYIEERPKTYEIGDAAPGRIGTWLGWEIVNGYMRRNPDVTLQRLMKESNAQKIFNESKYKPD